MSRKNDSGEDKTVTGYCTRQVGTELGFASNIFETGAEAENHRINQNQKATRMCLAARYETVGAVSGPEGGNVPVALA